MNPQIDRKAAWFIALFCIAGLFAVSVVAKTADNYRKFGAITPIAQPFRITDGSTANGVATTTEFFGSVIPNADALLDMGTSTKRWRNVYVSGGVIGASSSSFTNITWVNATGTNTTSTNLAVTGPSTTTFAGPVSSTNFVADRRYLAGDGSLGTVAYGFSSDPGSNGMYLNGLNTIAIAADTNVQIVPGSGTVTFGASDLSPSAAFDLGRVTRFRDGFFNSSVSSSLFISNLGTAGAPSYTFSNDTDTGFFSSGANVLDVGVGGQGRVQIDNASVYLRGDVRPYSVGVGNIGLQAAPWVNGFFSGTVSSTNVSLGAGAAGAPSLNFASAGDPTLGIFDVGAGMRFVVGGGTIGTLSASTANFSPSTLITAGVRSSANNSDDLGTSALSYRNIYASGTLFSVNVTSSKMAVTALLENTAALANVCVGSDGTFYKDSSLACLSSNPKLKDNLQDLKMDALSAVMSLKPKEWDWKPGQSRTGHDIGFDAVQAAGVDDRLVARMEDGTTIKGFRYQEYTAVLTAAIQQLQREINTLKSQTAYCK